MHMRTTLDLDASVLRELKERQRRHGGSLGRLASELLARALAQEADDPAPVEALGWVSRPMGARVDLADADALRRVLDTAGP